MKHTPESIIAAHIGVATLTIKDRYEWKARGKAWLKSAPVSNFATPNGVIMLAAAQL